MTLWIDAHLSPSLANWITSELEGVEAASMEWLGLRHAKDPEIVERAREVGAVVLTKDKGMAHNARQSGSPPVILVSVGNTTTQAMKQILSDQLPNALRSLRAGEPVVELYGR